jgi:hypothetical protein
MTWKQAKAEALRLVEQAALNRSELHLTEYQSHDRYLADHPTGRAMGDHNLIVRAAMREASRARALRSSQVGEMREEPTCPKRTT